MSGSSLTDTFNAAASSSPKKPQKPKQKTSLVSVRVTDEQRARLKHDAGGML